MNRIEAFDCETPQSESYCEPELCRGAAEIGRAKATADRYSGFANLAAFETEGIHYRIRIEQRASPIAIVAPHGGEIERGTSQIASAIAADSFSLYCFEGLKPGRPHRDLHITSERFDEPRALRLVQASEIAVGVHGRKDGEDERTVWLGGLDERLRDAIGEELWRTGFEAKTSGHAFPARGRTNICNRGRRTAGVQLELPRTLRYALVLDAIRLQAFAAAARSAIERAYGPLLAQSPPLSPLS